MSAVQKPKAPRQRENPPQTVLLRQPLPKYNFNAKKLPKEPISRPLQDDQNSASQNPKSSLSETSRTVSDYGAASVASETSLEKKSAAVKPFTSSLNSLLSTSTADPGKGGNNTKTPSAMVTPSVHPREEPVKFDIGGSAISQTASARAPPPVPALETKSGGVTPVTFLPNAAPASVAPPSLTLDPYGDIPVPSSALLAHAVEGLSLPEKLEKAESEIKMLRSQLEVQLQVNAEIKRLLVASVGDDFERKVENLARDRAQLAMDVGDFTRKMTEDYENLDQISIQADMWRSKYLASRVMVEELAAARAFYSCQFQDSQQVIQELLNERYELRASLKQSYKCLQQVKEAFDPFNAQKSHGLTSTNVLDLSTKIKQLSDAVRFRLLPAHANCHVMMPLEESWQNSMTRAELLAYEQLSKESVPPSFKHSLPSPCPSLTPSKSFDRFHPLARHENLTVNCCSKCKGEISVA